MPNQQLIEYIKQARAAGQNDADIKSALLDAGWQEADVDELFAGLMPAVSRSPKIIITITSAAIALLLAGGGYAYWYFLYEPEQSAEQQPVVQEVREETAPPKEESIQDTLAKVDGVESTDNTIDCGISKSFTGDEAFNEIDYEKDPAMVCIGKNLLDSCKKSYAILETRDMGKLRYEILGALEQDCAARLEYGEANQIGDEIQEVPRAMGIAPEA